MRRDLVSSAIAVVLATLALGLAYPLALTAVAQLAFPGRADGSQIDRDGRVLGSRLIAQDFKGEPAYFQSRPSQTSYAANATGFLNQGPNQRELFDLTRQRIAAYLALERRYTPGLTVARIPVDAVTNSGSGVDPHISQANARIQANRVASVRRIPIARVRELIRQHTDGRFLGVLGEPGVNVLELNLALDREVPSA
jgi:K+-transporting ATPase ATPase C chain